MCGDGVRQRLGAACGIVWPPAVERDGDGGRRAVGGFPPRAPARHEIAGGADDEELHGGFGACGDEGEAVARLSEAVYKGAERFEQEGKLTEAAKEYERVAIEFATAKIADVSLLNAGLIYEKTTDWSSAILMYSRLANNFPSSSYRPRAIFRTGKCFEKLSEWEKAADAYLGLVRAFPVPVFPPTRDPRGT